MKPGLIKIWWLKDPDYKDGREYVGATEFLAGQEQGGEVLVDHVAPLLSVEGLRRFLVTYEMRAKANDFDFEVAPGAQWYLKRRGAHQPLPATLIVRLECAREERVSEPIGPFSVVQLTYDLCRGLFGDTRHELAFRKPNGDWQLCSDGSYWSDIVVLTQ